MENNPIQEQINLFLEAKQTNENRILLEHEFIKEILRITLPLLPFIAQNVKVYSHKSGIYAQVDESRYKEMIVIKQNYWNENDNNPGRKIPSQENYCEGTFSEGLMLAIDIKGSLLKGIYKGDYCYSKTTWELTLKKISIKEFGKEINAEEFLKIISDRICSKLPERIKALEITKNRVEKITEALRILKS